MNSTAIRDKGDSHTDSNLEEIGGGTGIGTIIGAIAGGGKGALLGAGAGTGVAAATGRKPAEFTAESVYDFRLTSSAETHS